MNYIKLLIISLLITGCCSVPPQAAEQAAENATLTDSFVQLIESGETTRELEQKFIRSSRKAWHAQNHALNDAPLPVDLR